MQIILKKKTKINIWLIKCLKNLLEHEFYASLETRKLSFCTLFLVIRENYTMATESGAANPGGPGRPWPPHFFAK